MNPHGTETDPLAEVVGLLDLEPGNAQDTFRARHPGGALESGHVFGGLVAAQAAVAAQRTVSAGRPLHSLHAYFLHRGDPRTPIELEVERTRDGRSLTHRRVTAIQDGRPVMQLACSFAVPEPGLSHQSPMPAVADPDDLADDVETLAATPDPEGSVTRFGPFVLRSAETHSRIARDRGERTSRTRTWFRTHDVLPADPVLHRALLVYASDMTVLDPTTRPSGLAMGAGDVLPTSLDHAVWFHAEPQVDQWFLIDAGSPWAGAGRGLAQAQVYDASGTLIAGIAQEGLIRLPRQGTS